MIDDISDRIFASVRTDSSACRHILWNLLTETEQSESATLNTYTRIDWSICTKKTPESKAKNSQ
jgi:hypothetical protein